MFQHGSCRCFFPSMMVFGSKSNRSDGLKLEQIQTNMAESLMRSCRQRLQQLEMNKKNELFQTWLISQSENLLPPKKGSFQAVYFKSCLFHLHSPLLWDFWPTGCSHVVGREYPGAAWWHHWVAHLTRQIVPLGLSDRWASQWLGSNGQTTHETKKVAYIYIHSTSFYI